MKQYFTVSFEHSENIYCTNIAHSETVADVEAHYSKYAWVNVKPAADYEVETARRKGMPIVEIETQTTNTESKEEETEMKNYTNIENLVKIETQKNIDRRIEAITNPESDWSLKQNSTATRWAQYQAGQIDRETANAYAIKRSEKEFAKSLEKKLARLETIAAAPVVRGVSISVEWVRNRTWGANPTATVSVETDHGYFTAEGHASGCGYDKETAAVGEALNQINAVLKMLCDCKEKAIAEGMTATGASNESNRNFIAYGAGYGAIPYFEGGVGMSSFESVFNACGLVCKTRNHGKNHDYYYFEVKEVA